VSGKPKGKKVGAARWTYGRFLAWLVIAVLCAGIGGLGFVLVTLPDPGEYAVGFPKKTSFMHYRDREYAERGERVAEDYRPVRMRQISPYLKAAVIASEDAGFYSHQGFDYDELQDAIEESLEKGKYVRGASTISQQLVKNLYLTPERSMFRKVREMAITKRLEEKLTKERILELYLNVAEWGRGIYGCEAASRRHLGKSCADLTPREAALLAAALPAPRKFNPAAADSRAHKRQLKILRWLCLGNKIPVHECQ
jgi:monofunctional biosynthetic peptidoglycan transglycosylase